jgi:peptide/nickel transport system substrate-binding protein
LLALLVIVFSVGLAPLSAGASSPPGKQGGTLTIAAIDPPNPLNPLLASTYVPWQWYTQLAYEPLIRLSSNNQLAPGLATSWNYVGSGNKVFDLHLRSGARFSDGSPVNAAAVVASLTAFQKANSVPYFSDVTSIKATGPLTVELRSTGNPVLPEVLSDNNEDAGYIVSPNALKDETKLDSITDGAGPYMLDSKATVPNSTYVFVPNPYYYDPSAIHWHKIVVSVIADPNTTLAALKTGSVQVAEGDSTTAAAAKAAGLDVVTAPAALYNMTVTDPSGKLCPALANPKVRQALGYALDRPLIEKALFGKYGTTGEANGAVGNPGINSSLEHYYKYDVSKAKRLLAQAGYPHGFTVKVLVTTGQTDMTQMSEIVKSQWANIGVNLEIEAPPVATWPNDFGSDKWPLMAVGWPDYNLDIFASSTFGPAGFATYFHYPYKTIMSALAQAASSQNGSAKFASAMETIETNLITQGYEIPVATQDLIMVYNHKVGGIAIPKSWPSPDPIDWYPAS